MICMWVCTYLIFVTVYTCIYIFGSVYVQYTVQYILFNSNVQYKNF